MPDSSPHSRLPLPWQADQDAGGLWYVWSPGANENNNVVASNMLRADAEFIVGLIEQLEAWDEAFREILDVTEKWTRPLTDGERLLRIDTLAKAALARVPNPAKGRE